jgi:hypothetical protein
MHGRAEISFMPYQLDGFGLEGEIDSSNYCEDTSRDLWTNTLPAPPVSLQLPRFQPRHRDQCSAIHVPFTPILKNQR